MRHLLTYSVGGRRAFRGRDMKNAHEELAIKEEHFNDMKSLVRDTFRECSVVDTLIIQVLRVYDDKKRYVVSKQIFRYAFQHIIKPKRLDSGSELSARELEILNWAAKGISNKDIAIKLGLSLRTVKGYLADLFLKLNVASRTEAVIVSLRKGILTLNDLE